MPRELSRRARRSRCRTPLTEEALDDLVFGERVGSSSKVHASDNAERRYTVVVALTATLYSFDIELAHVDRGVYETLSFRVAQHPSEAPDFLLARVLAYCVEYTDGIRFSAQGLSGPDEPAVSVRDAAGSLLVWIDVGLPDATRLHKAAKAAPRVVVYTHKDPDRLVRLLEGERIHRAAAIELYAIDRALIAAWAPLLTRRMALSMMVTDGHVYLTVGETTLSGAIEVLAVPHEEKPRG
jgi:uncharacterized protein YaeQ